MPPKLAVFIRKKTQEELKRRLGTRRRSEEIEERLAKQLATESKDELKEPAPGVDSDSVPESRLSIDEEPEIDQKYDIPEGTGVTGVHRHFMLTIHEGVNEESGIDHGLWDFSGINMEKIHYIVANHEIGPKGGLHWQIYLELEKTGQRYSGVAKILNTTLQNCYVKPRWKSAATCIHYCKKPCSPECKHHNCVSQRYTNDKLLDPCWKIGSTYFEYGIPHRGVHETWEDLHKDIREGMDLRALTEKYPEKSGAFGKGIDRIIAIYGNVKPPVPKIDLRPWETEVLEYITRGFVKRQILWIWSLEHGTGKNTFMDYVAATIGVTEGGYYLAGNWKMADIMNGYNRHRVIHFDIPKSDEYHDGMGNVLERLSNGGVQVNTKFQVHQKLVMAVVIVTSNIPPPRHQLKKRILSWCLDEEKPVMKTDETDIAESRMEIEAESDIEKIHRLEMEIKRFRAEIDETKSAALERARTTRRLGPSRPQTRLTDRASDSMERVSNPSGPASSSSSSSEQTSVIDDYAPRQPRAGPKPTPIPRRA